MNQRKAKSLRRKSYSLAAIKVKEIVPEDQAALVNPRSIKLFEKGQDRCVRGDQGQLTLTPYSSRYYYKILKKLYKVGAIGVSNG